VVENSHWGGRLEELALQNLIFRYPHGDLQMMIQACEAALEASVEARQRIYNHFNSSETIGTIIAGMIGSYYRSA
jgi:hypothetical protein